MPNVAKTEQSRVFLMEGRAGPFVAPEYEGLWRAGAVSWEQGDVTSIQVPSASRRGAFDIVGKVQGDQGNPELGITARFARDALSVLLRLARNGCDNDLQVHIGACRDPKDFNGGWRDGKILVLEAARPSSYSTDELGALQSDERAVVNEETTFVGNDYYEIRPVTVAEQASAAVVQEVVGIHVCDSETCGDCGIASDGCSVVFAVVLNTGGSPGAGAQVIATQDAGANWVASVISSLGGGDDPSGIFCVGDYVVVISNESESLHYAAIVDILAGTATWTEIADGFVAGKGPNAIFSVGPSLTWIVGDAGTIYTAFDVTSQVEVQDAGSATTENLKAIHGLDADKIVAVGDNNAVIYTLNGGATWVSVTGPAPGVNLTSVVMHTESEWLVGGANGKLYATRNNGVSWSEKGFPGSGSGVVRDIKFSTHAVGWLAHDVSGKGRVLRTVNGGYSWYVAPEGTGLVPANDRINRLAVCEGKPNVVYGGGLADNGDDGIIVKAAA